MRAAFFLAGGDGGGGLGEELGSFTERLAAIVASWTTGLACRFWSSSSSEDAHLDSRIGDGERDLDEASLRGERLNRVRF